MFQSCEPRIYLRLGRHSSFVTLIHSRFARTRLKKNAQGMSFLPPLKLRLQLVARRGRGRAQQRNTDKPAPAVGGAINKFASVGARGLSDSRAPPIRRATSGRASTACDRLAVPEEQQEPRLLWIERVGQIAARRRPPPLPARSANQAINKSNVTNLQSIYKSKTVSLIVLRLRMTTRYSVQLAPCPAYRACSSATRIYVPITYIAPSKRIDIHLYRVMLRAPSQGKEFAKVFVLIEIEGSACQPSQDHPVHIARARARGLQ